MKKHIALGILLISIISIVQIATIEDGYITREKMIETAEAYKNHVWNPTKNNTFHLKEFGWQVRTPDNVHSGGWWIPDKLNTGIPYKWGGFSSISGLDLVNPGVDFDRQIQDNFHAGDIFTDPEKLENSKAAGVDCSGFISRAWNLYRHRDTNVLVTEEFSWPIKFDDLKPGDMLYTSGHAMLFKEFSNSKRTRLIVYEASGKDWKVSEREYVVGKLIKSREDNNKDGYGAILTSGSYSENFWSYTYNPIKSGLLYFFGK